MFPCWNRHPSKVEFVDAAMALGFRGWWSSTGLLVSGSKEVLGEWRNVPVPYFLLSSVGTDPRGC